MFESLSPYLGARGEAVRVTLGDALTHARDTQQADGGWVVAPAPRVLENAVVLYCLERAGLQAGVAGIETARAWLAAHPSTARHDVAALVESWLRAAALGDVHGIAFDAAAFRDPKLARRGLLLGALIVERGVADPALAACVEAALRDAIALPRVAKPWSAAEDAALYLVTSPDRALRDRALATIERALAPGGSVADNPLSTALAMWGAARADVVGLAGACRDYLARSRVDGTWRFCTTEVWDTALLARSFLASGFGDELVTKARGFIRTHQNGDGGWPYARGRDSDVDTTAMALCMLDPADDHAAIARAHAYLLARRDDHGVWPTWNDRDDPVAPDVVAHAIVALARTGAPASEYERAQAWLASRFDGGWTADWYDNRYYAACEIGLAVGGDHPHTRALARTLLAQQNDDGGFAPAPAERSSPAATGCALALLAEYVGADHPRYVRAVDFLVAARERTGWPGPTGMYGPRPFVGDYPVQTDAFAVLGLGTVVGKLTRGLADQRRGRRAHRDHLELA